MIIYLVGISCVGKTTIGKILAERIGFSFYDLDQEVERYYQKPIEKLQNECFSMNGFREKASVVLDTILNQEENAVIAGTPAGLKYSYLKVYKKHKKKKEIISVHLIDTPENILARLTFFDIDSKPMEMILNDSQKKRYLEKIKGDYNYYKVTLGKADLQIYIENVPVEMIPYLIIKAIGMDKFNLL
jgi:shikimate kinase